MVREMKKNIFLKNLQKRLDKQRNIGYYIKADFQQVTGEVAELAEGARLEIV